MRSCVREEVDKPKKLQLYYALRADEFQCEKCSHFYSSKKKLAQHSRHKECLDINFQPKKKYAQDSNGKFFCYFGCKPMFDSTSELEVHLVDSHSAADLKIWGISHLHIAKPDVELKDNLT